MEYTQACAATAQQALKAIQELDELLEVGFTGREVTRVESHAQGTGQTGTPHGQAGRQSARQLVQDGSDLPPVDVMFYYRVLTLLGTVADDAETVGDRLQILMAK